MGKIKMDGLAKKFLKSMQDWVDKRIPEKTRDCLRTKIAIVTKVNSGTYNVILAGDWGTYLDLIDERANYAEYETLSAKASLTTAEQQRLKEITKILKDVYKNRRMTQTDYNNEVMKLTLEDLTTIKTDTYSVNDYVVIGIVDNKLTNAFILYKTNKK